MKKQLTKDQQNYLAFANVLTTTVNYFQKDFNYDCEVSFPLCRYSQLPNDLTIIEIKNIFKIFNQNICDNDLDNDLEIRLESKRYDSPCISFELFIYIEELLKTQKQIDECKKLLLETTIILGKWKIDESYITAKLSLPLDIIEFKILNEIIPSLMKQEGFKELIDFLQSLAMKTKK